jgi:hypothetical protein
MYINSLARAFKINVNNVSKSNWHIIETAKDYFIKIFENLETFLDYILDFIDTRKIKLASDSQLVFINANFQEMQIDKTKYM